MFDQQDPRVEALKSIYAQWQQFPGRAPNSSGLTGLQRHDAKGWSDMLNQQTEALRLKAELKGEPAPNIRFGGSFGSANSPGLGTSSQESVAQGQGAGAIRGLQRFAAPMPEPHDKFMSRYGRG